jgi:hypothetical protein
MWFAEHSLASMLPARCRRPHFWRMWPKSTLILFAAMEFTRDPACRQGSRVVSTASPQAAWCALITMCPACVSTCGINMMLPASVVCADVPGRPYCSSGRCQAEAISILRHPKSAVLSCFLAWSQEGGPCPAVCGCIHLHCDQLCNVDCCDLGGKAGILSLNLARATDLHRNQAWSHVVLPAGFHMNLLL